MNFKNFVFGLGIFVVFALVLFQGLETFYPTPEWDDYCSFRGGPIVSGKSVECSNVPGLQSKAEACWQIKGEFVYEYDFDGCTIDGYCDECSIKYNEDKDTHSNRIFIIAILIGILVFVVGLFLLSTEPVGSALMASGIYSVFFGVIVNWRNFSNSWKFLLLFVLLIVLIWVALRFNRKKKAGFFRRH